MAKHFIEQNTELKYQMTNPLKHYSQLFMLYSDIPFVQRLCLVFAVCIPWPQNLGGSCRQYASSPLHHPLHPHTRTRSGSSTQDCSSDCQVQTAQLQVHLLEEVILFSRLKVRSTSWIRLFRTIVGLAYLLVYVSPLVMLSAQPNSIV